MPVKTIGVAPSYRFVVSSNEDKIEILLEDPKSLTHWSTGYLSENEFVTARNSIQNGKTKDYAKLFKGILRSAMNKCTNSDDSSSSSEESSDDSSDDSDSDSCEGMFGRAGKLQCKLVPLENDSLQLELSIGFKLLQSTWLVSYVFLLESISLERLRALKAKLCNIESEGGHDMVYLDASSTDVGVNNGRIRWNSIKANGFELLSSETPDTDFGWVELRVNGESI